ncbi:MAG: hypothetical protein ACRD18_10830 [Terriglobia bacterium]
MSVLLWFVFVGTPSWAEFCVGIAAGVITALAATGIRRRNFGIFRPYARWLLEAWHLPGAVMYDYGVLASVLFSGIFKGKKKVGFFKVVKYSAGGADSRSAARRALAITMASLPPNSLVIDIDVQKHFMLIHQVRPADVPKYLKPLGVE